VIDSPTLTLLQGIVRRENQSLLNYVADAYPWATAGEQETAFNLKQAVKEVQSAVAALGRFLFRRHAAPGPFGSYPMLFTTLNFIALDFLIGKLLESETRSVAELKADLARISDPEARAQVEKLLAAKEKTLAFLKANQRSAAPVS
jgi:hypothetical protein